MPGDRFGGLGDLLVDPAQRPPGPVSPVLVIDDLVTPVGADFNLIPWCRAAIGDPWRGPLVRLREKGVWPARAGVILEVGSWRLEVGNLKFEI